MADTEANALPAARTDGPEQEVLILSDRDVDPDGLDLIAQEAGYRVRVVLPDAFAAAGCVVDPPGIVIANLPTRDRRLVSFVEQVRSMLAALAPPIIVVAGGNEDEESLKRALELGIHDVLTKPVLPALLRVKIAQHFRVHLDEDQPIGAFRLKGVLGKGGMSAVYLAERDGLEVALKVIHLSASHRDYDAVARFRREAEVLKSLTGQGAPAFYELGRSGSVFYYAMERVRGEPLHAHLQRSGAFEDAQVRALLVDLAAALAAIHARDFVHRDVKPSNIIVTPDGAAKLIDFGLAKSRADNALTTSHVVMGTAAYLAPEVVGGNAGGPEADAFALGMTAFEAALGTCPMRGTPFEIMTALAHGRIPDPVDLLPHASVGVLRTIRDLLAADPVDRLRPDEVAASVLDRGVGAPSVKGTP